MMVKDYIESALKELNYAKHNAYDCPDNHANEYRIRIGMHEHTKLHIDNAISILEMIKND